jgi:hypothetical protein
MRCWSFYLIYFLFFWDCLNENLDNNRFAIVCDRWRKFLWFYWFCGSIHFTCDDKIKIRMLYQHYHIIHTDKLAYSRARLLISLVSHFSCSEISNAALFAVSCSYYCGTVRDYSISTTANSFGQFMTWCWSWRDVGR